MYQRCCNTFAHDACKLLNMWPTGELECQIYLNPVVWGGGSGTMKNGIRRSWTKRAYIHSLVSIKTNGLLNGFPVRI